MQEDLSRNVERFTGFADCYDTYRPTPPPVIVDILTQIAGVHKPKLVVDLGCGTGLSTCIWDGRAEEVVGIEPSDDMRSQAEMQAAELCPVTHMRFVAGLSTETGLPDGCADIVTCSQSLHWMEPDGTFAESARILRTGGVFAAIDCDWPPVVDAETEMAYAECSRRIQELSEKHGVSESVKRWSKDKHLERIKQSGRFKYTREIVAYGVETGNAERLVGLMLSFGSVQDLFKLGLSEEEAGITALREAAMETLGPDCSTWYFGYRIRVGVK